MEDTLFFTPQHVRVEPLLNLEFCVTIRYLSSA